MDAGARATQEQLPRRAVYARTASWDIPASIERSVTLIVIDSVRITFRLNATRSTGNWFSCRCIEYG